MRIRKASQEDIPLVVDALADAFQEDPIMKWVSPKTSYPGFAFALTVPSCLAHQYTYVAEDGSGAASWLPPGTALESPISVGAIAKGLLEFGPRSLLRAVSMLSTIEKHHPQEPHYYLFTIGTRRTARGLGVGSALMREVLAKCDAEQMPAYLESSNRENVPYYRRHGFEVQDELQIGKDGPTMWLMWRSPRNVVAPPHDW